MNPLRILFITTGLGTGGAEMALLRLIRHLPDGIIAQVISLTDTGTVGTRLMELGIPVEALNMRPGPSFLLAFVRLSLLIRSLRPDIVQTWMYHADLFGGVAARLAGARRVVWGLRHANLDPEQNKRGTLAVAKFCARLSGVLPTAIVSCSQAARRTHVGLGYRDDLFTILPNGIELDNFRPDKTARWALRDELGLPHETPLIGCVARFDQLKNHRGFFHAAGLVHDKRPDVHFILAGTGMAADNAQLCVWRDAAGVASTTHLLGERGDMPKLMAGLDVLASSSWGEAFPNVLAEAMACGVPCAATDAGDSAEIVGDTGRIVAVGDMPALAAAMLELVEATAASRVARSAEARQRIVDRFGIEAVAAAYADFYRTLI